MNHWNRISKLFFNKRICAVSSFVGAVSGFTYLTKHEVIKSSNNFIDVANAFIDVSNNETEKRKLSGQKTEKKKPLFRIGFDEDDEDDPIEKVEKFEDDSSLLINDDLPYEANFLIVTTTGAVTGYLFGAYYPITIPSLILYNLITKIRK